MKLIICLIAGILIGWFASVLIIKIQRVGVMFIEHSEEQNHDLYHLEVDKPVELWQRKKYITFKVDATKEWIKRQ